MARSVTTIAQSMFEAKAANSNLSGLTSTSQTAIWRLWIYIVAACINVLEQLQDVFRSELETISANARPGTPQWVQNKTFNFQYSATVPQIVQVVDSELVYPTDDDTLKIVTRCSVITSANGEVNIKVAKATSSSDTTPIPLAALEKSSLESYWDIIGFAGINYKIINLSPDLIGVTADIYYDGQYASTIQADAITALNNYLASIPFDGYVSVLSIEDALQKVAGIVDVKLNTISGRASTTSFGSRILFYDLATSINNRRYSTAAGYCKQEIQSGATFADTLTFIVK